MTAGRWDESKTFCRQFLSLLDEWKTAIGYPHKAFEAGSHALLCLLWKLHGNRLHLEEEAGSDDGDEDDDSGEETNSN